MTYANEGLQFVAQAASEYLEKIAEGHVGATASSRTLFRALDRTCPETGMTPMSVVSELLRDVSGGLVASSGPRHFGFVLGGVTPASLMADWLTTTWDQNAQVYSTSPAAAVIETIVARWILDLLNLPRGSSVGFVTGTQASHTTALAAARNCVLARVGYDSESFGLFGAPRIVVFMSEDAHATLKSALRMGGIGSNSIIAIRSDLEGRMDMTALKREIALNTGSPMIICAQAGNVNSGAFESVSDICEIAASENAWVHVDGAFGLWAAVSPKYKHLLNGFERADSWAVDAHKWLNVPYDSGIVVVKESANHRSLKSSRCAYAGSPSELRDGSDWVPENSRRARAIVLYAALREQGRSGIASIVERCCSLAREFAEKAATLPYAEVVNDVVLNQVLICFDARRKLDLISFHEAVADIIQEEGRCWIGTTIWKGKPALRVSICNWLTTIDDIAIAVECLRAGVIRAMENGK